MAKQSEKLQKLSTEITSKSTEFCRLLGMTDSEIKMVNSILDHQKNLSDEEQSAIIYLIACSVKFDNSAKNCISAVDKELGISDKYFRDKISDLRTIYASSSELVSKIEAASQAKMQANQSEIVRQLTGSIDAHVGKSAKQLQCPCHGAQFDPFNGARVLAGPAPTPLAPIKVKISGDWVVEA